MKVVLGAGISGHVGYDEGLSERAEPIDLNTLWEGQARADAGGLVNVRRKTPKEPATASPLLNLSHTPCVRGQVPLSGSAIGSWPRRSSPLSRPRSCPLACHLMVWSLMIMEIKHPLHHHSEHHLNMSLKVQLNGYTLGHSWGKIENRFITISWKVHLPQRFLTLGMALLVLAAGALARNGKGIALRGAERCAGVALGDLIGERCLQRRTDSEVAPDESGRNMTSIHL